jgi:SAM-dependent methyltransferase
MSGIADWDARFDGDAFFYGTTPTAFLTDNAGMIPQGAQVLSIAEGEGRNAVWMAQARGCAVTGMDGSAKALTKAARLAKQAGVTVDLQQADIANWDWRAQQYDLVVACFIQFAAPPLRDAIFAGMKQALAPGGRLMLTGYTAEQLTYRTGGPGNPALLYSTELLRDAFDDLTILRLATYEKDLSEGDGHHGRSALIDLIADKPA